MEDDEKQALSQQFIQAAATINTYPGTKEYFNYAILPEYSLTALLNVDERLESCLKRYLRIQHGFVLSGNTLSPKILSFMNSVEKNFADKIALDGPDCDTAETEY